MKKDASIISTLSLVGITIISGLIIASAKSFADTDTVDEVTITVPVSCTMSSAIATGQDHTASLSPSTYSAATGSDYVNGIGKTTLTTFCNDYNGFSIYAVGYTGDTIGTNTLNGTSVSGNATIATGVYTSGDTTSSWSMKVDKVTDTSVSYNPNNMTIATDTEGIFSSWHTVPSSYTKVAEYHATTGSSATDTTLGAKVETTYAAYISPTQPADTYTGKVKYTMVHPYTEQPLQPQQATAGCINYFANASNAVGTMGCQSVDDNGNPLVDSASVTLLASNFSRAGYGFAGWSDTYDYRTNANAHFYGPQETITVPTGTTANGLSLYAVWVASAGSLQDTEKVSQLCGTGTGSLTTAPNDGTANLSSVSALTDQRDNNTYAIAKLADGQCWMIENLRLEAAGTVGNNQTNPSVTNASLAQGYGTSTTYGNFSGLADAESISIFDSTTANSLYYSGTQSGTASIDIGTSNDPGYRMPRYDNRNNQSASANRPQNPTANDACNGTTRAGMYSYGNYYTWHAAIADTTYYSSGDHGTTSLCPTGWRLPIGSQSTATNSFGALSVALGGPEGGGTAYDSSTPTGTVMSKALRSYPNNFLYPGYPYGSGWGWLGESGFYWSSATISSSNSYLLSLGKSVVHPGNNYYSKYFGCSIRCTVSAGT